MSDDIPNDDGNPDTAPTTQADDSRIGISRQEGDATGRYAAATAEGEAELTYSKIGGNRIQADHTGVPDEASGRGIGGALVARMVADAREEGRTIVPACPFVKHEFDENPDWADVRDAG